MGKVVGKYTKFEPKNITSVTSTRADEFANPYRPNNHGPLPRAPRFVSRENKQVFMRTMSAGGQLFTANKDAFGDENPVKATLYRPVKKRIKKVAI
jgi:hypothetical protein